MRILKIIIGCEESQEICKAFRELGHEAYSCDIKPCSGGHPEWHIQDSIFHVLCYSDALKWDIGIFHPPCTYLTVSNTHMKRGCTKYTAQEAIKLRQEAKLFFMALVNANIDHIAIENPIGIMNTQYRKPDQIIRPFQFGENSTKATCLWLKGLPLLKSTNTITPDKYTSKSGKVYDKWWFESSLISNLEERSKFRSKTFPGIARAMAEQWSNPNIFIKTTLF